MKRIIGSLFGICAFASTMTANAAPVIAVEKPTTVVITKTTIGQPNAVFVMYVKDPTVVADLYDEVTALKPLPAGVINGAMDVGTRYKLTFKDGTRIRLIANADPTGNRMVELSTNGKTVWGSDDFWNHLAEALHTSIPQLRSR